MGKKRKKSENLFEIIQNDPTQIRAPRWTSVVFFVISVKLKIFE